MSDVLMRAGCFIGIIVLGYVLKSIGFFKDEDFTILSRIAIRITLPATIISSFASKEFDLSLLVLSIPALMFGLIYVAAGWLLQRRRSPDVQAFAMVNLAGYNTGTFVIPFAQSFLSPLSVIAIGLFDIGNSMICLGLSYSLAAMVKDGTGFSVRRILKLMAKSVPLICYLSMVVLKLLNIRLPGAVLSFADLIADANAFMAMLMIGVGFRLSGQKSQFLDMAKLLFIRYGLALVFALFFYFATPFPLEVRQAMVIVAFCPIGSAIPSFTAELKGDVGLSSALNSASMAISIVITVTLLTVML